MTAKTDRRRRSASLGGSAPLAGAEYAMLAVLLVLAAVLRVWGLSDRVLWYDELQSVAHAAQPLRDLFVSVIQHDPHPPLHYLQLHFWMLFGTDEVWLRLNSILWSLLAIPPIYLTARHLFGTTGGLWAALLFACSPLSVFFAQEVRMYAMEMCLVAFNFYFLERLLSADRPRPLDMGLFFLTLLLEAYSQGIGALLLVSVVAYAWLRRRGELFSQDFSWFPRLIALATVCVIPWVVMSQGTKLNHLSISSLLEVPDILLKFLLGPHLRDVSTGALVATAVLSAVVLLALTLVPRTRKLALAYLLLPFGLLLALAFLVTPLWHYNALASFLPPLSILAGGGLVAVMDRAGRYRPAAAGVAGTVVALVLLPKALAVNADTPFRTMHADAASYLDAAVPPGARIKVTNRRDFWSIAWYLAGPGRIRINETDAVVPLSAGRVLLWEPEAVASPIPNWLVTRAESAPRQTQFGWLRISPP